ncbi:permease (plasmid) [Gemmatirosa kalamazoonensis]|uniref:Permease n=2 Tax=Gemmatirosa kalamazoonensis TaxID=861299 RepID=W0RMG4_9BACT|nr:permease [Gemmatirosa kalamazoonensis]
MMELRSAARGLMRAPTVAVSAILCLALGIGATTAISSAIDRALVQALPFRAPDRLVAVFRTTPQSGPQGTWPQSVANYLDLAAGTRRLSALAAISQGTALVTLKGGAVQASQLYVTGNLFPLLGIAAERGRLIGPEDDRTDAPLTAVLSDEFWRATLGADPTIVGRTVIIDGDPTTIVGIAPRDLRLPVGPQMLKADVWMATRFTAPQPGTRRNNFLQLVGRLAPGATPEAAETELRTLFQGIVAANPELRGENVRLAGMQPESVQSIRTPLLLLFGAVCMVLLIAATNVAGLLLARGVQRRREQAVRSALGASRWDAMRPALAESAVVTVVGATLGLGLAAAGVRTIGKLAAARMPQLEGLGLDPRVLLFAVAVSAVVAVVCGAVPAWRGASVDPQDALRGGRGGGIGRSQHRMLRTLVVFEIALSLVLLIGAGLVLKGFAQLLRNDPGFETAHVMTMRVAVPAAAYTNQRAVPRFLEPALDAMRAIPRVESVAAISAPPYVNWGNNSNIRYEGQPKDDPTRQPIVEQRTITPGFFDVTKQRLIAGRLLNASDDERPEAPAVVVVNQALVKRDFHGENPVGRRFYTSDTSFATIVGVVSDIRNMGPATDPQPEMYWTYRQSGLGSSSFPLVIRVRGEDPTAVTGEVRAALRRIDSQAAVSQERAMPDVMAKALGRPRFYFSLLGTFAGVALLLALAGLYGVLSYVVAQRTRELGIRTALGSSSVGLVALVTRDGLALVVAGVVLGLAGGAGVTRLMEFMLYGVSPLDVVAWSGAALLMIAAGALATLVPARRATRVDPTIAMRAE